MISSNYQASKEQAVKLTKNDAYAQFDAENPKSSTIMNTKRPIIRSKRVASNDKYPLQYNYSPIDNLESKSSEILWECSNDPCINACFETTSYCYKCCSQNNNNNAFYQSLTSAQKTALERIQKLYRKKLADDIYYTAEWFF